MQPETNELGQVVGHLVPGYKPAPWPPREPMVGRTCRLEPLDADRHAEDLFAANGLAEDSRYWTYLPYGPFETLEDYRAWIKGTCTNEDPQFHAVIDQKTGKALGIASYLRIDPANSSIEVGHIHFSPAMQRSALSTEAMYLMMARAFDELGYRRYEWKCNALNEASKAAALRLGFTYEGTFRQMSVSKGRNRDTAWFSILDSEWPAQKAAFQAWLSEDNFGPDGKPLRRLAACKA